MKFQRPVGQHHTFQHAGNGTSRRRGEKGAEKVSEEIVAQNFPKLMQY